MTFLNPLVLFGLFAAAIPILLHLLNLRKLRTIEFSTLAFLKELEKTRIRRLKLRQILLLILRTLLILLIVLAFARPTLKGSLIGNLGSHAKTTAVFLIDDSYSMTVSDEHGELLTQAKDAAKSVLHLFKDGDEVFLVPLSSINGASVDASSSRDFGLLKKNIDEIRPAAKRRSLEEGLRIAARLLSGAQNYNKEVYVFSDLQQGVLNNDPVPAIREKLFPGEARFFFVPLGKRTLQNFGIESVDIPSSIFERDKSFTVRAAIGNYSGADVQDHVVSIFLNGTRVAERSIDIRKGGVLPADFSVVANSTGFIEGMVEIEDDDFQYDNRRYFALEIPDRIHALLVGSPDERQFPKLALSTRTSASESALVVEDVAADRLSSVEIKRADVIVLCSSQGISAAQISELASFVNSGGGLVLFPDDHVDPATFSSLFSKALSLPSMVGIDRPSKPNAESESFIEFDKVELQHPLFEGMFETPNDQRGKGSSNSGSQGGRRVESPRIRTSARFALTPQSNPIITLTNGAPFLTEQRLGTGRIFLFAIPPTTEWADFPLKGVFVPLLHRSVLYLTRQQTKSTESLPGSEVVIRSSVAAGSTWTIRNPEKLDVTGTPTPQAFQQSLRFSGTDLPGIYSVLARDVTIQKFVVNLDARESQTQKASGSELSKLLQRLGIDGSSVRESRETENLERTVLETRFGVELWKYLLILALIVAVIELFVARSSKQKMEAAV